MSGNGECPDTKQVAALTRIDTRMEAVEMLLEKVVNSINGNGKVGLRDRLVALETKFWIILLLILPLFLLIVGAAIKGIKVN